MLVGAGLYAGPPITGYVETCCYVVLSKTHRASYMSSLLFCLKTPCFSLKYPVILSKKLAVASV